MIRRQHRATKAIAKLGALLEAQCQRVKLNSYLFLESDNGIFKDRNVI